MANDSLEHGARDRQSHSTILETLVFKLYDVEDFDPDFQEDTFSLTFSLSHWYLLLRLLHVGCTLADQVLDPKQDPTPTDRTQTAQLWNTLSNELADLLDQGEVIYGRTRARKNTR